MNIRLRRIYLDRAIRVVAGLGALALAVLAFLLAHDVRSWRDAVRGNAMRYGVSPTAAVSWAPPTYLPVSLSGRLLDIAPDRRRLEALRLFALADAVDTRSGVTPADEALLQSAEKALSGAAQDPNPAVASQAYELLSVILFKDAKGGFVEDVAAYSSSIAAMQNAVRVDPANKQAEADLELLLRQFAADRRTSEERQSNNQGLLHKGSEVGRGKGVPPLSAASGDY